MSLLYNDDTMLTTGEAARVIRVSRPTIIRYCELGYLTPKWTPAGHRRIRYADLVAATAAATAKRED
jgi:predicted site-specific integrase-resolvase